MRSIELACWTLGSLLLACGGRVDPSDGGDDASSDDAGGACTDLVNVGADVPITYVASDPPPMASSGGAVIPSGTYTLVDYADYTGPSGVSKTGDKLAETIRIVAQNGAYDIDWVMLTNDQPSARAKSTAQQTGPGQLSLANTCPSVSSGVVVTYSLPQNQIVFREVTGAGDTIDTTFALVTK